MNNRSLIIVALDAATWNLINPLMEKGKLPHFAWLVKEGASGVLKSMEPLITAVVWTTIFSGKRPNKHGVHDFRATAQSVRCKRVWDIAAEAGMTVGLMDVLLTWPPQKLRGFVIPGALAQGPETHPPEFRFLRELTKHARQRGKVSLDYLKYAISCLRHGVAPQTVLAGAALVLWSRLTQADYMDDYYRRKILGLKVHLDVFMHLYTQYAPDLSIFYTNLLDECAHHYWKYMEPHKFSNVSPRDVARYGSIIPQAYEEADCVLGHILENRRENTIIVVVSDHGSCAAQREDFRGTSIKVTSLLAKLGLADLVTGTNVSWHSYLRVKDDDPRLRQKAKNLLRKVVFESTGEPLFQVDIDEYGNIVAWVAPAHLKDNDSFRGMSIKFPDSSVCPVEEIVEELGVRNSGAHDENGILIVEGPGVKKGYQITGANLLDVAPLVLYLLGLPVGKDMEGRVLTEMLTPEYLEQHLVHYVPTYEQPEPLPQAPPVELSEEIEERLRGLGYID